MTEADWIACTDSLLLLKFLRRKTTDRKLRHFASSCCRNIWHLLKDEWSRTAIEVAERFADGDATRGELEAAEKAAGAVAGAPAWAAAWAVHAVARSAARGTARAELRALAWASEGKEAARGTAAAKQADTFREIFGNPFALVSLSPWLVTSDVRNLAELLYQDRHLPSGQLNRELFGVLGDALEEAGCDNSAILDHCHRQVSHVRGCWLVDLVLEKK